MKNIVNILAFLFAYTSISFAQQIDYSELTGKYLGQKEPGIVPEIFAPGLVSIGEGVHGNIVFTPDFSEAAWHPNFKVNGNALIYIMKFKNGAWEKPEEFILKEGFNYSEPYYSYDGEKLYYLSGNIGPSGNAENEKIWYVERKGETWSEPELLSSNLPAFHWQFSLDKHNNLYFGGKSNDRKAEIYYSKFEDNDYENPIVLNENINSEYPEFSPCISPDNSYLVFLRLEMRQNAPPKTGLFVSFRDSNGNWTESKKLDEKINEKLEKPLIMIGAPRITPDGKYLFFTSFNGNGHMAYWVSTKIIESLKPKDL